MTYKLIQESFQKEYRERSEIYRKRLAEWRKQPSVVEIEKPTNIAAARRKGYKAKEGYVVVRVRVKRGKRKTKKRERGRKPSKSGKIVSRQKSLQLIAEERAGRKFKDKGYEVLNSYFVGSDGSYKFFEVILVSPKVLPLQKGRVFRALTYQGRKARGL
jgi:large subunit ribosomal protein L15e